MAAEAAEAAEEVVAAEEEVVAVGLYQLEDNVRKGGLQLFKTTTTTTTRRRKEEEGEDESGSGGAIVPLLRVRSSSSSVDTSGGVIETSGVFELKWYKHLDRETHSLALAEANGDVSLHKVKVESREEGEEGEEGEEEVQHCEWSRVSLTEDEGVFCLCVDTSARQGGGVRQEGHEEGGDEGSLLASTSDGDLHLVRHSESCLDVLSSWHAHDMETWSVCFDATEHTTCYSGADDGILNGWDVRQDMQHCTYVKRGVHEAGICCIRSHASHPSYFLTSSYDETVKVWDKRNVTRPLVIHEVATGGGVWRADWWSKDPSLVLAACMYGGCKAISLDLSQGKMEVAAEYKGHESIAYGVGFLGRARRLDQPSPSPAAVDVISCSFYDNQLHGWQFNLPQPK